MRVLALSGSLRRDSLNTRLLRAAQELGGPDVEFISYDSLATIPPFNQELEHRQPAEVHELRQRIEAADAVLIATPEYNGSIPGQLKNALDWVSRPRADSPFLRQADRRDRSQHVDVRRDVGPGRPAQGARADGRPRPRVGPRGSACGGACRRGGTPARCRHAGPPGRSARRADRRSRRHTVLQPD